VEHQGCRSNKPSKMLQAQAKKRSIWLQLMPVGMKKHEENTSSYNRKQHTIFWRVEWEFPSCNEVMISPRMNENEQLSQALAPWLEKRPGNAPTRQRLQHYSEAGIGGLQLLLRIGNGPGQDKPYIRINPHEPLKEVLKDKTVIEYPTVVVVLPSEVSRYTIWSEETYCEWTNPLVGDTLEHEEVKPPSTYEEGPEHKKQKTECTAQTKECTAQTKIATADATVPDLIPGFTIAADGSIIRSKEPATEAAYVTQNAPSDDAEENVNIQNIASALFNVVHSDLTSTQTHTESE